MKNTQNSPNIQLHQIYILTITSEFTVKCDSPNLHLTLPIVKEWLSFYLKIDQNRPKTAKIAPPKKDPTKKDPDSTPDGLN
jgi:hypothetical protein